MQNLEIEYVDINSIRPYEKNARQHGKIDVAAIVKSINEFGFNDPIGVWQDIIVEGHGRLLAAKELGMDKVPVIRLDNLTDEQRRAYQDGDIVYCDVPYEQLDKNKCDDYGVQFDSLAFYEWVKTQPYQIFFSSYEISDNSFEKVKIKAIQSLIGAKTNSKKVNEYLYSNRPIIYDQAKMEKQN